MATTKKTAAKTAPAKKEKKLKVLIVGGTGIITSGTANLAISRGMDVYILNRGNRPHLLPKGAKVITADYLDEDATKKALGNLTFDTVLDCRIFNIAQIEKAFRLFAGRTKQYIYISSGTVYKKPVPSYIVTEESPKGNLHSMYARNKYACEQRLLEEIDKTGFPGVIVRPSLTYSDFNPLMALNSRKCPYSIINRMRKGKQIVVHGDGTSLWTITHTDDFAKGMVGLFGNSKTIGEAFHITSDEVLDWDRIYTYLAHAAGVDINIIHIASDYIGDYNPIRRDGLLGDHSCSIVFDNSKIKKFVPDFKCVIPFEEGAKRIVKWFDADPAARETVEPEWDAEMDGLIAKYTGRA